MAGGSTLRNSNSAVTASQRPVVACDLDEVLGQYLATYSKWHNRVYGTHLKVSDFFTYRFWEVQGGTTTRILHTIKMAYSTIVSSGSVVVISPWKVVRSNDQLVTRSSEGLPWLSGTAKEAMEKCYLFHESPEFKAGIPLVPGAQEYIRKIGKFADVHIVTSRQDVSRGFTTDTINVAFLSKFDKTLTTGFSRTLVSPPAGSI